MWFNPASNTSETYELRIIIFENDQPGDILTILNNSKKSIYGTVTTTVSLHINYLWMTLNGEYLQEFDVLAIQNNGTTSSHLKAIQEG